MIWDVLIGLTILFVASLLISPSTLLGLPALVGPMPLLSSVPTALLGALTYLALVYFVGIEPVLAFLGVAATLLAHSMYAFSKGATFLSRNVFWALVVFVVGGVLGLCVG